MARQYLIVATKYKNARAKALELGLNGNEWLAGTNQNPDIIRGFSFAEDHVIYVDPAEDLTDELRSNINIATQTVAHE